MDNFINFMRYDTPVTTKEGSLRQAMDDIERAFRVKFTPGYESSSPVSVSSNSFWVVDVYPAYVIACQDGAKYFRVHYWQGLEGLEFGARETWQEVKEDKAWIDVLKERKEKAAAPAQPAAETQAAETPPAETQTTEKAAPVAPHMQLGNEICGAIEGCESTLDAYGQGPGEHGSAWKAPGNQIEAIATFLEGKGFARKKNNFSQGSLLVETGADEESTFIYITDDNA